MLDNRKLGTKLIGGFTLVAAIAVFIGIAGLWQMGAIMKQLRTIGQDHMPSAIAVESIYRSMTELKSVERTLAVANLPQRTIDLQFERYETSWKKLDTAWKTFDAMPKTDRAKRSWDTFTSEFGAWKRLHTSYMDVAEDIYKRGNKARLPELAHKTTGDNSRAFISAENEIDRLLEDTVSAATISANEAASSYSSSKGLIISIITLGFLLAILIGVALTLSITRPMAKCVALMKELSLGHLSARLNMTREDEIGQLTRTMDDFASSLQKDFLGAVKMLGEGEVDFKMAPKDDRDEISPAVEAARRNIELLIEEMDGLTKSAAAGNLSVRGNPDKFQGGYSAIVKGVNDTLTAVISPLQVAAACGQDFEGRHPPEDNGRIPGRLRRNKDQSEQMHRRGKPPCRGREQAFGVGGKRQALHPGGRLPS